MGEGNDIKARRVRRNDEVVLETRERGKKGREKGERIGRWGLRTVRVHCLKSYFFQQAVSKCSIVYHRHVWYRSP